MRVPPEPTACWCCLGRERTTTSRATARWSPQRGATPVLAYHRPQMSAPGIDVETLPRLTDVGVVGLEDASGDGSRMLCTLDTFAGWFYVGLPWQLVRSWPPWRDRCDPRGCERRTRAVDRGVRRERRRPTTAHREERPCCRPERDQVGVVRAGTVVEPHSDLTSRARSAPGRSSAGAISPTSIMATADGHRGKLVPGDAVG